MTLQARPFPSITPAKRSQSFGVFPESRYDDLTGFDIRFKRGTVAVKHRLTITFTDLSESQAQSVFEHYQAVRGSFVPFAFDEATTFCGDSNPPGDQWRYISRPVSSDRAGGFYDLTCEFVAFTQDLPVRSLGTPGSGTTTSIVDAGDSENIYQPSGVFFRAGARQVEVQTEARLLFGAAIPGNTATVEATNSAGLAVQSSPGGFFGRNLAYQRFWHDVNSADVFRRSTVANNVLIVDEPAIVGTSYSSTPFGGGKALKMSCLSTSTSEYRVDLPTGIGNPYQYLCAQVFFALDASSVASIQSPGCIREKTTNRPLFDVYIDQINGDVELYAFDGTGSEMLRNTAGSLAASENLIAGNDSSELYGLRKYMLMTYIKDTQGVAISLQISSAADDWSAGTNPYESTIHADTAWTSTANFDLSADDLELVVGNNSDSTTPFDGFILGYRVAVEPPAGYDRQATIPAGFASSPFTGATPYQLAGIDPTVANYPTGFEPGVGPLDFTVVPARPVYPSALAAPFVVDTIPSATSNAS